MTVIDQAEARKASRRPVLDMALIRFGEMSVGCVIRNLTDTGAALDVGPQGDIPDQFTMIVTTKKKIYSCNVVWRKNRPHWRGVPLTKMVLWVTHQKSASYISGFDFRGKSAFARYDCYEFVKCTLLIDATTTEQLAFTSCAFKDCNIDQLRPDKKRGFYVVDDLFYRPLEERRLEFKKRLAQALAARKLID
jgi:hypothetical protein